ncbi:hypothetical protein JCM3774_002697 [Rhodotorula dairenensis]
MEFEDFVAELHQRALPRNYVWDAKAKDRALTQKFVEHLLFNMDTELSIILHQGLALKGTGLLDEETAALAVSTGATSSIYRTVVNYNKFNNEAPLEWSKIAAHRESNAQQLRLLTKKAAIATGYQGSNKPDARPPRRSKTVNPQWVNDYRLLNSNTVKDRTPLPVPDVVLADAACAKIWGKINMTNAFFQTTLAEEDIEKAAIETPWGLFEWTVMPKGLCNALATHQARVNEALWHLIGVCCEAFVDDIIIYSDTLEEYDKNCRDVLEALRQAGLYCSKKKTDLFTMRPEFLGHVISRDGLEADKSKVEKIENWPRPRTVSQVRGFLGLVQYLQKFVPGLAEHSLVLTPLTKKGLDNVERLWGKREEKAFVTFKKIVASLPVLQPLQHDSEEPIWLMAAASKVRPPPSAPYAAP